MPRWFPVLGLLTLLLAPDPGSPEPMALEQIRHARALVVERLALDSTVTSPVVRELGRDFRVASRRKLSGEACRHLAERIADAGFVAGHDCSPVCLVCPTQLVVRVAFVSRHDSLRVLIFLRERCLWIRGGTRGNGHARLGTNADSLLLLIRRAMADDPAIQAATPASWPELTPDREAGPDDYVDVDEPPQVITRVAPEYPSTPGHGSVEGTVVVRAHIGVDGRVSETRIEKSIPMLDESVAAAVRQWRFEPARCAGRSVPVWMAIPFTFTLR